jgi:hypothetical protein
MSTNQKKEVGKSKEETMPDINAAAPAGTTIEQETMRRVTRRLLPLISLLYLASYIDRSNVSL